MRGEGRARALSKGERRFQAVVRGNRLALLQRLADHLGSAAALALPSPRMAGRGWPKVG